MVLRNLLFVTYQFPPIGGSGVQRAAKLAQYLPRAGWRPHVITAGHTHYPLLDPTMAVDHDDDVPVHRVCGLEPAGLARAVCRHLAREEAVPRWLSGLEDRLYWRLDRVCTSLPLPEAEMLWVPAAIRQARRLIQRYEIEAVVTTSPPHSAHIVGRSLKRRLGLPWIADLRDPIIDNFAYRPSSRLTDRFWRWLERTVARQADVVTVTCPELAEQLAGRYRDVDAGRLATITNGYDPADAGEHDEETPRAAPRECPCSSADAEVPPLADYAPRGEGCFVLAYVGAFYREQTIEPVLEAIRELRARRPDVAERLEFRMIGSISAAQRRLLRDEDAEYFHDAGYRSHEEAIAEMRAADVLLLLTPANEGGRLCIPAKTFEYLAFGGHVLAFAHPGTELRRILQRAGNVTLVEQPEAGQLGRAIESCYDAWHGRRLDAPRDEAYLQQFRRDRLAEDFAETVERCVDGIERDAPPARLGSLLFASSVLRVPVESPH
jgi:glycosyltransferase involved in cell wall biosynthesis